MEFWIMGISLHGNCLPILHGMTSLCAHSIIQDYKKKYPDTITVTLTVMEVTNHGGVQDKTS